MGGTQAAGLDRRRLAAFGALATIAIAIEWAVARGAALHAGGPVPIAIAIDLVVVLPLAFAAIVLRPAKRSILEAAPIVTAGAFVAGALLASRADGRGALHLAAAIAELALIGAFVRRVRGAAGELRGAASDDLLLRVGALRDPLARLAGAELLVLYYALVAPWVKRPARRDEFAYTESSGLGGVLLALGLVIAMEGFAVHFLVQAWSPRAAWVHAALDGYALLWLVAIHQAARLRPVAIVGDRLLVRASLLWTLDVPIASIGAVDAIDQAPRGKDVLRAALGTAPVLLLTLRTPSIARGPMGIRRSVTRVALYVDEPARLRATLGR